MTDNQASNGGSNGGGSNSGSGLVPILFFVLLGLGLLMLMGAGRDPATGEFKIPDDGPARAASSISRGLETVGAFAQNRLMSPSAEANNQNAVTVNNYMPAPGPIEVNLTIPAMDPGVYSGIQATLDQMNGKLDMHTGMLGNIQLSQDEIQEGQALIGFCLQYYNTPDADLQPGILDRLVSFLQKIIPGGNDGSRPVAEQYRQVGGREGVIQACERLFTEFSP